MRSAALGLRGPHQNVEQGSSLVIVQLVADIEVGRVVEAVDGGLQADLRVARHSGLLQVHDAAEAEGHLQDGWGLPFCTPEAQGHRAKVLVDLAHVQSYLNTQCATRQDRLQG